MISENIISEMKCDLRQIHGIWSSKTDEDKDKMYNELVYVDKFRVGQVMSFSDKKIFKPVDLHKAIVLNEDVKPELSKEY
jgi:hypothetical protein